MEQVSVKVGTVKTVKGADMSSYLVVTFRGDQLGFARSYADANGTRGRDVTIYRVHEEDGGGYVVSEVTWSLWEGDEDVHALHYYTSIDEMTADWEATLERAGVIERRRLTLREWVVRHG